MQILLMFLGMFACSTSVIMIKESTVHPVLLAGYRLLLAALLMLPMYLHYWRNHRSAYTLAHLGKSLVPGLILAAHFITWNMGARMTGSANASLLVNLTPLLTPFVLYAQVGEVINRREVLGTAIALAGLLILARSDFNIDRAYLAGDLVCLASMALLTFYMVAARRNRDVPHVWLYMVPLFLVAGSACFAVGLFTTAVAQVYAPREYLLILGLAVVPTTLGHTLLSNAMRRLRGQMVMVCNQSQFMMAGLLALVFFREVPALSFYPASFLVLAGAVVVIRATPAARGGGGRVS